MIRQQSPTVKCEDHAHSEVDEVRARYDYAFAHMAARLALRDAPDAMLEFVELGRHLTDPVHRRELELIGQAIESLPADERTIDAVLDVLRGDGNDGVADSLLSAADRCSVSSLARCRSHAARVAEDIRRYRTRQVGDLLRSGDVDAADAIAELGAICVIGAATESPNEEPAGVALADIVAYQPVTYTVPVVVPESSFGVVTARPGRCKSALLQAASFCLASGTDFAGKAVSAGFVFYIAAEGVSGFGLRARGWLRVHWKRVEDLSRLRVRRGALYLNDNAAVDKFIESARRVAGEEPIRLVVVDTWSRCGAGGDENSATDTRVLIASCERIQLELGCAVVVLHHPPKQGDDLRGSSALEGAVDWILKIKTFERPEAALPGVESSGSRGRIVVEFTKDKDGNRLGRRWEAPVDIVELDGGKVSTVVVGDLVAVRRGPKSADGRSTEDRILAWAVERFEKGLSEPSKRTVRAEVQGKGTAIDAAVLSLKASEKWPWKSTEPTPDDPCPNSPCPPVSSVTNGTRPSDGGCVPVSPPLRGERDTPHRAAEAVSVSDEVCPNSHGGSRADGADDTPNESDSSPDVVEVVL